jgi:choline dehydrogenase-like flavoprotein
MSEANHWDAIVIGSGLGGLSAAAAFANRGKRVLLLERLANSRCKPRGMKLMRLRDDT